MVTRSSGIQMGCKSPKSRSGVSEAQILWKDFMRCKCVLIALFKSATQSSLSALVLALRPKLRTLDSIWKSHGNSSEFGSSGILMSMRGILWIALSGDCSKSETMGPFGLAYIRMSVVRTRKISSNMPVLLRFFKAPLRMWVRFGWIRSFIPKRCCRSNIAWKLSLANKNRNMTIKVWNTNTFIVRSSKIQDFKVGSVQALFQISIEV